MNISEFYFLCCQPLLKICERIKFYLWVHSSAFEHVPTDVVPNLEVHISLVNEIIIHVAAVTFS